MHRIFELGYEEYALFVYNDAYIHCSKCNVNWSTDDGWNWYYNGGTGDFGLREWTPTVFLDGLTGQYENEEHCLEFPEVGPGLDQDLLDDELFERPVQPFNTNAEDLIQAYEAARPIWHSTDAEQDAARLVRQQLLDQRPPLFVDADGESAYCPFCGGRLEAEVYWE